MELTFANGTSEQQSLWREALHHLLHLPFDAIAVDLTVTFVDPSEVGSGHTDFAVTTYTYGSEIATTVVRNDAPGFGPLRATMEAIAVGEGRTYSAEKHYADTAVHELGHALFASLPEASRQAIAELFGASSADEAVINPKDRPWQDRVAEGIAETFKEAFLPSRFRMFPNRTNHRIPYKDYPEFRRLFREGVEAGTEGEEAEPLSSQMVKLPIVAALSSIENPVGAPWVQWPPADAIGAVFEDTGSSAEIAYRSPVHATVIEEHPTPRYVAALHTGTRFEGDHGVIARYWSDWTTVNDEGRIEVWIAADTTGGGRGYRLLGVRGEVSELGGAFYTFRLERWSGGTLDALLWESGPEEWNLDWTGIAQLGVGIVGDNLSVWIRPISGIITEIAIVKDTTYRDGYVGIGVNRNDGALNMSHPSMRPLRAGPLVSGREKIPGQPVEVPGAELDGSGFVRGSRPSGRPVVGSYG